MGGQHINGSFEPVNTAPEPIECPGTEPLTAEEIELANEDYRRCLSMHEWSIQLPKQHGTRVLLWIEAVDVYSANPETKEYAFKKRIILKDGSTEDLFFVAR